MRHGDDQGQEHHGIGRGIYPGTAVPDAVLGARRCAGLLLQGWRDGLSAYLSPPDALAMPRELAVAFGSRQPARRGDQSEIL